MKKILLIYALLGLLVFSCACSTESYDEEMSGTETEDNSPPTIYSINTVSGSQDETGTYSQDETSEKSATVSGSGDENPENSVSESESGDVNQKTSTISNGSGDESQKASATGSESGGETQKFPASDDAGGEGALESPDQRPPVMTGRIWEDQAIAIACRDLGISEEEIADNVCVELDTENDVDVFVVDFFYENASYEYAVEAKSGKISRVEKEYFYK